MHNEIFGSLVINKKNNKKEILKNQKILYDVFDKISINPPIFY